MKDRREMLNSAGILTFTYGDNYGQRLQNLAMQEFLKNYFIMYILLGKLKKKSHCFVK